MENKADNDWEQFEEQEEDALSLSNLNMQESNSKSSSALQTPRSNSLSSAPEFFEFSNEVIASPEFYHSAPDIVFCGKLIEEEEVELNEYQKRDYLTMVRSHSMRKPPSYDGHPFSLMRNSSEAEEPNKSIVTRKSASLRISSSKYRSYSSSHHRSRDQKVNITSLTSMSAKSRRRMFMFGPVKFKPEMELSAIKERQGKRLTTMMSPPTVLDGGKAVVYDGGKRAAGAGDGKRNHSHWRVAKLSLMGRAHLSHVFTKSFGFGCLRFPVHSATASGNIIKVAN